MARTKAGTSTTRAGTETTPGSRWAATTRARAAAAANTSTVAVGNKDAKNGERPEPNPPRPINTTPTIHRYPPLRTVKIILLALALLLPAACGGGAEDEQTRQVSVEDFRYTKVPGGARFVSGKLHNPTAEPIKNALIQITLFDADNRYVATMSVPVHDVQPGQHKPFRQPVDNDEAVRGARVRGILVM